MAASTLRQKARTTITSLSTTSADLARSALHLPQTYSNYVASNPAAVSNVESSIRSLTYLLPGARLRDSELASESLHTFVQLLSIYHDRLLKNRSLLLAASPALAGSKLAAKAPKMKLSLHAKYTTFWTNSSTLYAKIATMLKIAQYTELLWEMVARRRGGEKARWRVVILLETFKALCRLLLLRLTNSRPLVSPPMPLREDFAPPQESGDDAGNDEEFSEQELKMVDEMSLKEYNPKNAFDNAGVLTPPLSESEKHPFSLANGAVAASPAVNTAAEPFGMPRTGLTLPSLPTPDTVSAYLLSHVITPDDVKPAKQLLHRLTTLQGQAAEVMYILRPIIYAILMQRVARAYGYEGTKWKRHWTPWLVGLSMEYFARQMAKRDLSNRVPGGARSGLSALERDELKKRGWSMAWWGMRGAFYENVTKRWVLGFADTLKGKPLLDLVAGVVEDYDFLWSNNHFSTSTM